MHRITGRIFQVRDAPVKGKVPADIKKIAYEQGSPAYPHLLDTG